MLFCYWYFKHFRSFFRLNKLWFPKGVTVKRLLEDKQKLQKIWGKESCSGSINDTQHETVLIYKSVQQQSDICVFGCMRF